MWIIVRRQLFVIVKVRRDLLLMKNQILIVRNRVNNQLRLRNRPRKRHRSRRSPSQSRSRSPSQSRSRSRSPSQSRSRSRRHRSRLQLRRLGQLHPPGLLSWPPPAMPTCELSERCCAAESHLQNLEEARRGPERRQKVAVYLEIMYYLIFMMHSFNL